MQSRPQRILLIDDDARLHKLLVRFLNGRGFDVDVVPDAERMDRQMQRSPYDLLLLDVMMPGENGFAICKRLREAGDTTAVIILSAKGDDVDRIVGLQAGADDYVAKPFNPEELLARIQAVLRRRSSSVPSMGTQAFTANVVKFGAFALDLADRALTKDGELIPLTTSEFTMLKAFTEHLGQPISRQSLAKLVNSRNYVESGRSIDQRVSRLRKLLNDDPQNPELLKTVWGVGYVLTPHKSKSR